MKTSTARKPSSTTRVATRATFKPRVVESYVEPATEAERIARYKAAMVEWHAYQDRAAKATAAYNKQVNRNQPKAKKESAPKYNKAYYDGGFRMVIDGTPIRMAAHVKQWKKKNRDALCQGFDRYGLTLRAHNKYGFTDDARGYWERFSRYIESKEFGTYDGNTTSQRLHQSGYAVVWNSEAQILLRTHWTQLFCKRREVERKKSYVRISDLFTAARVDRKRLASQLATLGIDARKSLSEREAREVTRLIRSLHNATN